MQDNQDQQFNNENGEYNEEMENEIYLLELQQKLTQMRKDRKKADQDALLLKNRLNLLKGEEDKVNLPIKTLINKNK